MKGHTNTIFAIAFSPDGACIATAGRDQTIRIWDTGSFTVVAELRGHTSYIWSLAWSPDGAFLVSGSGDHTVRIWDSISARERMAKGNAR